MDQEIETALERMGYWYPPDAIRAAICGDDFYVALDGKTKHPMREHIRSTINKAACHALDCQILRFQA